MMVRIQHDQEQNLGQMHNWLRGKIWREYMSSTGTGGVYGNTIPPCAHFLWQNPSFCGRLQSIKRKALHLCIFCNARQSPSRLPCNFNDRGEEAESYRGRSKSTSIVLGFQIIYNWATILWIAKKEILNCDRILRFRKWPFRRLWASGWVVEAPRAWVGACPRLQTKNLTVGR